MVAIHHHAHTDERAWSAHAWSRRFGHPNWLRLALLAGILDFWAIAAAVASHLL